MKGRIRIKYWPVERTYSTPNKTAAWTPDRWAAMSAKSRDAWARAALKRANPTATYVGWEDSDA